MERWKKSAREKDTWKVSNGGQDGSRARKGEAARGQKQGDKRDKRRREGMGGRKKG